MSIEETLKTDQEWPSWMTPQEIERYQQNRWRVPTGRLISRTGHEQPVVAGYRVHHTSRMPRSDVQTFYFEPIPEAGNKTTGDAAQARRNSAGVVGPLNVTSIPKAPRDDERPKFLPVWALKMREEYEHTIAELKREKETLEMSIVSSNQAQMYLNSQPSAMALFGGETNIEALNKQLALSPKFKDLAQSYREYIALLGLGMRLNPEFYIHAWVSEKSVKNKATGKWEKIEVLNVMLDYKALLLKAKSERRVTVRDRRLTPDEMRERGIDERDIEEGSISWVVEYFDLADAIMSKQAGIEYSPLRGYGFWAAKKDKERWSTQENKFVATGERIPNDVANGRDGAFMAWKRATRALYYQIADMSLVFMPQPGMQAEIVDEDIYQFVPDPEKTVEGEFSETTPAAVDVVIRWQDEPGRVDKAAEWMASLGVTDEQYLEATGTDWRTYDIGADEFKYAVELIAESQAPVVIDGDIVTEPQQEASPESALDAIPPEPPAPTVAAAETPEPEEPQEPVVKATEAETIAIVEIFAHQHALTVSAARQKLAELASVTTLYNYTGTKAELQALADGWKPDGKLL